MITDGTNFAKYNNFSSNEFKCKCCGKLKISEIVLDFCQAWRNHIQEGVTITSAYRCGIIFSFTTMNGFHIKGMTKHKINIMLST